MALDDPEQPSAQPMINACFQSPSASCPASHSESTRLVYTGRGAKTDKLRGKIMLTLQMFRIEAADQKILRDRLPVLRERLAEHFKPVLLPALSSIASFFDVPANRLRSKSSNRNALYFDGPTHTALEGEIYVADGLIMALALYDASSNRMPSQTKSKADLRLELTCIGKRWNTEPLSTALRVCEEVYGAAPASFVYKSRRFDELKTEGRTSPVAPTPEERQAITLLSRKDLRALAIAIKTSGGLLIRDLNKQLPSVEKDEIGGLVTQLKDAGLVNSEIVVICTKSQAQIARVPNRDLVTEMAHRGVRCACGRAFSDERIEEALTITELTRSLVDKARWMTELLVEELVKVGVPRASILVEQNLGGDEIDCLANISGELVLFELKDKEFNLGNAYSFGAKISIVKPNHRVIVTTEYVGSDAKDHFARARQAEGRENRSLLSNGGDNHFEIQYIEGLDSLQPGLESLADSIYRNDTVRLLDRVLSLALVDGGALLKAFETTAPNSSPASPIGGSPVPEDAATVLDPSPTE